MNTAQAVEKLVRGPGSGAAKLRLYAIAVDSSRTLLQEWLGPFDTATAQTQALEELEERALRHANVLGGSHAFYLDVRAPGDEPLGCEVFRVSAETLPGAALATEPANEAGLVGQAQRHAETFFKMATEAWRGAMVAMGGTLDDHRRELKELRAERSEMFAVVKASVLEEHQRELELKKLAGRQELAKRLASTVEAVLPDVAAGIVHKVAKSPAAAAALDVRGLVSTLRPEQLAKILETLDPEQRLLMINAMKHLAAEKAAQEAKDHGPPPPPPTSH